MSSFFSIKKTVLFIVSASLLSCAYSDKTRNHQTETFPAQAIKLYQTYISPIDGERCRMYPSCSEYSRQAFQRHGFLTGWIMTCDRLLRCGRNELNDSPQIVINGNRFCDDSLHENDSWWYEPDLIHGVK